MACRIVPVWVGLLLLTSSLAAQESIAPLLPSADPEQGRELALVCSGCHSLDRAAQGAQIGPPLWNIVNRRQASIADFAYSDALQALRGTWTYEALGRYLADPQAYAPGNRMPFPGYPRSADRAAVIAYLRTLSAQPAPLPEGAAAFRPAPAAAPAQPFGGLPEDTGRELVFATCTVCHSIRQVTQQGLSRERWDDTLTWMIERQGLRPPGPVRRAAILDYLAKWYGPERLHTPRPHDVTFVDGLPVAPGQTVVAQVCSACHSLRQVTQQGLARWRWDELLDWMVEEQGMAEFSPARRELVLTYLERWYGPERLARAVSAAR